MIAAGTARITGVVNDIVLALWIRIITLTGKQITLVMKHGIYFLM